MTQVVQSPSLTWINSSDGMKPKNPKIRTLIRKQAMSKAAAARKRSRQWGKQNSCQSFAYLNGCEHEGWKAENCNPQDDNVEPNVTDIESLDSIESMVRLPIPTTSELAIRGVHRLHMSSEDWIPASPPSTGYEAMRIRFDFDVIDLSGLTSIHVGRTTAQHLHDKPARLLEVLQCKKWSYFDYLPSRFGQTRCLDEAICCVAALVRQWLTAPGRPNHVALEAYSKAVGSLQVALNDPSLCRHPDVLCATEILSIFELLDSGRDLARTPHASGVATLLEFRGPDGYKTDFEKSLLLAQAGPIYTEAIHNNAQCFLEEPAWQATYQSILSDKFASMPFANAYVTLWACLYALPGLLRNIRSVVYDPYKTSIATREQLLFRIFDLRSRLMDMGNKNKLTSTKAYGTTKYSFLITEEYQSTAGYEILGALAISLVNVERYIAILDSSLAVTMEAHTQQLAWDLLDLEKAASKASTRAAMFLACKAMAARAVLLTANEWQQETACRAPNTVMSKPTFNCWDRLSCPQRISKEWELKFTQIYRHRLLQSPFGSNPGSSERIREGENTNPIVDNNVGYSTTVTGLCHGLSSYCRPAFR
ncbi:MAG: hypothetical protein Q9166_000201 [cf. Caloplaca sp. 2 TL-2023]